MNALVPIPEVSDADLSQTLLADIRAAVVRARLAALDLEAIGVAVKNNLLSVEDAIGILDELGALHFTRLGSCSG